MKKVNLCGLSIRAQAAYKSYRELILAGNFVLLAKKVGSKTAAELERAFN